MRNSFIYVCVWQKPLLNVCVGDNPTSLNISQPAKKDTPAYLMGVASIKKLNTLNMATTFKTLTNNGLAYAVKRVKGVFHKLNSLSVRAVAPMFSVLGLSNCLIYSGLNCFLGLSKNLFLFV